MKKMRFSRQFSLDEYELGVLTAIKEFDFYYYNLIRSGRTEETDLHIHMMRLVFRKSLPASCRQHSALKRQALQSVHPRELPCRRR